MNLRNKLDQLKDKCQFADFCELCNRILSPRGISRIIIAPLGLNCWDYEKHPSCPKCDQSSGPFIQEPTNWDEYAPIIQDWNRLTDEPIEERIARYQEEKRQHAKLAKQPKKDLLGEGTMHNLVSVNSGES